MTWIVNGTPEVDAESNYKTIVIVTLVLCILATGTSTLRVWVRARVRGMAADDWMAVLSVIFAIIYSIICIVRKSPNCCLR